MIIILFLVFIINIILGLHLTKKFFNPLTMYNVIWLIVVDLYQLQLSQLQTDLNNKTLVLFIASTVVFSLSFIFTYKTKLRKNDSIIKNEKQVVTQPTINKIFVFWLFVELLEAIYSKGLPIVWKLTGSTKTYMDYGIPSIHGLMNSVGLVLMMLSFYLILNTSDKKIKRKNIFIILICMLLYLCLITRQVIISAVIQMVIIYLFTNRKRINWKKLFILVFVGIIGFGILGNIRTGYESFLSVSLIETKIPKIFIGFYWVYMYLTMTVANINNAVILGVNHFGGFAYLAQIYLPTVISNILFDTSNLYVPNILVSQAYTVSGYYIFFYNAFGNLGVYFIAGIYGILGAIFTKKFQKVNNEENLLYYAVFMQIILLSFFYNHLLYLPSGFQLIVIYLIFHFKLKLK